MNESYECVESDVGGQLWQYDMPGIDPDLQQHLEDHLTVCAECRLQLALHRHLAASKGGSLVPEQVKVSGLAGHPNWVTRSLNVSAGLSLAACLLLMFLLPPKNPNEGRLLRAENNAAGILRPVSGEVIPGTNFKFIWTAVENASAYRLQVRDPEGIFEWVTETKATSAELPADHQLPANTALHAYLEIIPPYLTPDEGIDVTFSTGSWGTYFTYRARVMPLVVWMLGLAGLGLLGIRILVGLRRFEGNMS